MLVDSYEERVSACVIRMGCDIQVPDQWAGTFFDEDGPMPTLIDEQRKYVRFRMRTKAILQVRQTIPAIERSKKKFVYSVDVSRCGLGFLHAKQLFSGEICDVWLPTKKCTYEVMRCRYYNANCYLIGARCISCDI